ncbi:MAG: hypothetical protein ACOZIN_21445 [Myxococcota bacterium]
MPRWCFAAVGLLLACVAHRRLEQVQALSDEGKELYSKYRQFMTEGQQDQFLDLPSDEERGQFIAALKIEERLARYPRYIQEAIWSQEVVPGMDREAVLLTWSTPMLREWDEQELAKGNEVERWSYRRFDQLVQVILTNGVVTSVERAETQQ